MSNIFREAGERVGRFILLVWPAALFLIVMAIYHICWEDFEASRRGYLQTETYKINAMGVATAIAWALQLMPIILTFMFGRNTKRLWLVALIGAFAVTDIYFDVTMKSGGSPELVLKALLESIVVFTLGSDLVVALLAGFLLETFDEFIISAGDFLDSMGRAITHILGRVGVDVNTPDQTGKRTSDPMGKPGR